MFIFDNCYKKIGFSEENCYYWMKHLKKDKIFIVACKQCNRRNIITEHPKTSHKFSKTIKQSQNVRSNIVIQENNIF